MATSFEPHQIPERGCEVSHKWYVICGKRWCVLAACVTIRSMGRIT
jgi:hypothetical protein